MREFTYFFTNVAEFFKYFFLNMGITSLYLTLFFIYTFLRPKIKSKKVHNLLLLGAIFIAGLFIFSWYLYFGLKAIILPLLAIIITCLSIIISLFDE